MLELTFQDITHPADLDANLEYVRQMLAGEISTYSMDTRYVRKSGDIVWVNLTVSLVRNKANQPECFVSVVKDISERKQAQMDLKQIRAYTDHLLQKANVMIISLDTEGQLTHFNPAAEAITGYSLAEVRGKDWFEVLVPRDRYPEVYDEFNRLIQGGMPQVFENPIVTKDGRERFISWSNSEIRQGEEIVGLTSFGIDITERKQAEETLRESEEKFRLLVEQSPFSIQILKPDGHIYQINETFKKLWGIPEETLPEVMEKYNILEDEEAVERGVMPAIKRAFRGEVVTLPQIEYDATNTMADLGLAGTKAKKIYLKSSFYPVKNSKGEVVNIVNVEEDMTERKHAEELLKASETKFRNTIEQSPVSIQIHSTDGCLVQSNAAYATLYALNKETLAELYHKYNVLQDKQAEQKGLMPFIEKPFLGETVTFPIYEYDGVDTLKTLDIKKPISRKCWVQTRGFPIKDVNGKVIYVVFMSEDITERIRKEEEMGQMKAELLHATRTGTLVELTAALAHEINHPLGSILNNANAAKRFLESGNPDIDEIRAIIDDIISEDRRASDVIHKLRALMKKSVIVFSEIQINDIIEEILTLTHSELVIENISLSKQMAGKLPIIHGDRVQLQQAFLNLIINAIDAMRQSKIKNLHISTAQHDAESLIVCVQDSGMGFDDKEKDSLFSPFFTTKKEGMGMGLSVNMTIIKSHGGNIWAENNEEGGASFFLTLPIDKNKKL